MVRRTRALEDENRRVKKLGESGAPQRDADNLNDGEPLLH